MRARALLGAPAQGVSIDALREAARTAIADVRARARGFDRAQARVFAQKLFAPVAFDPGAALLAAPLAMALGAALYLGLDAEPAAWPAPVLAVLSAAAFVWAQRSDLNPWVWRAATLVACFATGFGLTDLRVASREAPRVLERSAPYEVEGWVENIDASTPSRRRYTIRVARLDGSSLDLPRRVRVGAAAGSARLGETIRVRAVLSPPQGPPLPGAYDFSRSAYFEQLGAVGYSVRAMTPAPDLELTGRVALGRRVALVRGALSERLHRAGGEGAGGVLAALVTGDRSEIEPATTDALYISGLGHILSISGMHLALIGGGAFFILSWGFAAIEPLARRMNVRKLAAAGALAVSLLYLVISGGEAPTQRSFVMIAVAFVAILVDRRALTQRGVAIAALLILLYAPENASSPGFQMSFAAVVALVAANDLLRRRARREGGAREPGFVGGAKRFLFGLAMTSLVAGSATAPYAAYHFNRIAVAGFAANLAAMPVFSTVVMPSAAIAGALAPLGLEAAPAWIGARGIDIVVAIGTWAAAQPGAMSTTPSSPPFALALVSLALVVGAVATRGRWRIVAPLALVALLVWRVEPKGDLWLGEGGGWVARVAGAEGELWVGEIGRGENYGAELFARRSGGEGAIVAQPGEADAFHCDTGGCVGRLDGRTVAIAERWASVIEDCGRGADVVLTPGRPPARVVARCSGVVLIARRGRGDRGGVVDLAAAEIALDVPDGASRPWRRQPSR
jgi:competence protein ComEC